MFRCWIYTCQMLDIYMLDVISLYSVKSSISLLTFCLDLLFIIEIKALKAPTIIAEICIFLFKSGNMCFLYLRALIFDLYMFIIVISSSLTVLSVMCFLVSCNSF